MPLFQNSVVSKYLQTLDKTTLDIKWVDFKTYLHNPEIQSNIKNPEEEQFKENLIREISLKILGYSLNPEPNFKLTTEYKKSKKADVAILFDNKVKAVIEPERTDTTDLGKIETQDFGYKNNQPDKEIDKMVYSLYGLTEEEIEIVENNQK